MTGNLILMLIALISSVSCATVRMDSKDYPYAKEEFIEYLDNFVKDSKGVISKDNLYSVTVDFDDLEGTVAGVCYPNPFDTEIYIDKDWWYRHTDKSEREELVYHELGHCVLLRLHSRPIEKKGFGYWFERLVFRLGLKKDPNKLADGCPTSYMDAYTLSKDCIDIHHDYYIEELFGRADVEGYKKKVEERMRLNFWDEY